MKLFFCVAFSMSALAILMCLFFADPLYWVELKNHLKMPRVENPSDAARVATERLHKFDGMTDDGAFRYFHGDEIMKTIEIVEIVENNGVALALTRYSIGSKVFRESVWLRKVDRYWYVIPYFSEYRDEDTKWFESRKEWILTNLKKEKEWKKESAQKWE